MNSIRDENFYDGLFFTLFFRLDFNQRTILGEIIIFLFVYKKDGGWKEFLDNIMSKYRSFYEYTQYYLAINISVLIYILWKVADVSWN